MTRRHWTYGPGRITLTPQETYSAYVSLGHGKRRRAVLKTLDEAKAWILAGTDDTAPDRLLLEDALRARALLPDGVTLEEAAREWAGAHRDDLAPVPLADAWERYSADASRLLRPRTFKSYRHAYEALAAHVGDGATLSSVSPATVEALVATRTDWTRNHYVRALATFFAWCIDHNLCRNNPASTVRMARIPAHVPAVLPPDEVRRLFRIAEGHPAAAAYFALGFFAGLRPEEAMRARHGIVRNGFVVLDGRMTKTADARTVAVRPNLAAWLEAYPIPDAGFSARHIRAVRRAFGPWPQDVARHSYATYAYEASGDAARVAAEMGHQGTGVFFRHYRALAAPGSGADYFSIMPGVDAPAKSRTKP